MFDEYIREYMDLLESMKQKQIEFQFDKDFLVIYSKITKRIMTIY